MAKKHDLRCLKRKKARISWGRRFFFSMADGGSPVLDKTERLWANTESPATPWDRGRAGIAAKHPLYITDIERRTNIYVGGKDVYGKELLSGMNLQGIDSIDEPLKVDAKYGTNSGRSAVVEPVDAAIPASITFPRKRKIEEK